MVRRDLKRKWAQQGVKFIATFFTLAGVCIAKENSSLWSRAEQALRSGANKEAVSLYNQIAQDDPKNFEVYRLRALAKHKLGDFKGSVEDFNQAVLHYPVKQYMTVIREDGKTSHWDQRLARMIMNRGYNRQKLGEMSAAERDYDSAIKLFPYYEKAFLNRAHLHKKTGRSLKSISDFSMAIKLNPKNSDSYFERAIVYSQINNATKACLDLKSASDLGNTDAKSNYDRLSRSGYCQ